MINLSDYTSASSVFDFFLELTRIPRPSGSCGAVADYLENFAKSRGLWYERDSLGNLIIRKSATAGYESRPTVVFQAHTDMVAQKLPGLDIDMTKSGVTVLRDGDFLTADGTTLGADDGIGVAYALAVLDSTDIPHPEFEAVFTVDEETGLFGASALNADSVRGRLLINIDSDAEGIFTVGCAGGVRVTGKFDFDLEKCDGEALELEVSGALGGHSGVDIDKGRANASKLAIELISRLEGVRLIEIAGGNMDNAITRNCKVKFTCTGEISDTVAAFYEEVKLRYSDTDPDIKLTVSPTSHEGCSLSLSDSKRVISLLSQMPDGIIAMSEDIKGLVETSLNLGMLSLSGESLTLSSALRSSKDKEKAALTERVSALIEEFGGEATQYGAYPAWEYRRDSHLRDCMCEVFRDMYGADATVLTIHAGLECGILSNKLEGLDCVSIGPDAYDIHTTEERLSISSTARVWEFLKEVLKRI
ncbi:MAG: aminoacyl-histidine dipeptidase [Clostridia bacterium]|nr:aminoacyl-histidine dipeptidase [Clostridia bacterium]